MTLRDAGPAGVAAALTVLGGLATGGDAAGAAPALGGLLATAITTAWAWVVLSARDPRAGFLSAAAGVGLGAAAGQPGAGIALAAWVLGGLAAGGALRRGRRADLALLLAILPPLALTMAAGGATVGRALEESGRRAAEQFERGAGAGADEAAREAARSQARAGIEMALKLLRRFWPALVALSLIGHGAVAVLGSRWLAARAGSGVPLVPWPPPREWRLPFYVVWGLVAGLALLVTRRAELASAGENLSVVAAALCGVQGLAVMAGLLHRVVPPWGLLLLGGLTLLLMAPLVAPVAALLGLLDQWVDFRRLAANGGGPEHGS